MKNKDTVLIDNREVTIDGERNLLEVIRKANIELPTFCYHSDISIYGACRLCMVEVEGRGLVPACSTIPEPGLKIKTNTDEIRSMRRIIVELLIANHSNNCPTCAKGPDCKLQALSRRLGINKIRFKPSQHNYKIDTSSPSLIRDPNKCVLCGDCVRVCDEIQSVGVIDFAHRGSKSMVLPSFGKSLDNVECVYCGQCARVCPTGAIMPKPDIDNVWKAIHDPKKIVVAHIAPAVRVALGEAFGFQPGNSTTSQIVSALKKLGFNKVFDTSFTADLTVIEETNEFLKRANSNQNIPMFTSCCPAWIKFAEQYYPDIVPSISSCRSPQQMFGSLCKNVLTKKLGIEKENMVVVSIMPCTAKKFEAGRPEFENDGIRDIDYVLTTQELIRMIEEAGLNFSRLEHESFDLPFGFKTGAGVIFGNSGGVTEAVLRYATEKVTGEKIENYEFKFLRGEEGIRTASVSLGDKEFKFAVVNGLKNARKLIKSIQNGSEQYDFVEVMACPGGCIGGAGQPIPKSEETNKKRTCGIFESDKMMQLHKPQDNPYIKELYENALGAVGGETAHELLHTEYKSRKRIRKEGVTIVASSNEKKLAVTICFGTGCILKGSQRLLKDIMEYISKNSLDDCIEVKGSFCFEKCDRGPVVRINDKIIEKCTLEKAIEIIRENID